MHAVVVVVVVVVVFFFCWEIIQCEGEKSTRITNRSFSSSASFSPTQSTTSCHYDPRSTLFHARVRHSPTHIMRYSGGTTPAAKRTHIQTGRKRVGEFYRFEPNSLSFRCCTIQIAISRRRKDIVSAMHISFREEEKRYFAHSTEYSHTVDGWMDGRTNGRRFFTSSTTIIHSILQNTYTIVMRKH